MHWLSVLRTEPKLGLAAIRWVIVILMLLHLGIGTDNLPIPRSVIAALHHDAAVNQAILPFEAVSAVFLMLGFLTRFAALVPAIFAFRAILHAKLPKLTSQDLLNYNSTTGKLDLWSILTDVRADFVILFGCVFLIYEGAGRFSFDWTIVQRFGGRAGGARRFRSSAEGKRSWRRLFG